MEQPSLVSGIGANAYRGSRRVPSRPFSLLCIDRGVRVSLPISRQVSAQAGSVKTTGSQDAPRSQAWQSTTATPFPVTAVTHIGITTININIKTNSNLAPAKIRNSHSFPPPNIRHSTHRDYPCPRALSPKGGGLCARPTTTTTTMIDLGLARVGRLLQNTPQNWKAIHVAGTNGKGSICAYISAMLRSSGGVSCARFTSPHLVDRWDCIAIDDTPVSEELFLYTEERVKRRNAEGGVGATEFELLTATAFEIFHRQNVDYGVIEVGLGGRLDATNVLKQKAVTVIAKIGLDHQSFLGNTVEDIALQKAGIMRRGVPCVVDRTNQPSILKVIEEHAKEVGADLHYPEAVSAPGLEPHQLQNLACAHLAFRLARPEDKRSLEDLLPLIRQLEWPGRLQKLDLSKVTSRQQDVLLDGAHNSQSAEVLAAYVQRHLRSQDQPVTWVVAATQGKDMDGIFGLLLQPGDRVSAVRFGPVDGMPWVKPSDPAELLAVASKYGIEPCQQHDAGDNVRGALEWASERAGGFPLVIAGSLYLVSSVFRVLRQA